MSLKISVVAVFCRLWTARRKTSSTLLGSVQSVMSDSLRPHELQHCRPPCPSPTPKVYSNSCPLSWWCHPTISSSVVPFSWLQSFPASSLFKWVSASRQVAKVLEFQIQPQSFQWTPRTDLLLWQNNLHIVIEGLIQGCYKLNTYSPDYNYN